MIKPQAVQGSYRVYLAGFEWEPHMKTGWVRSTKEVRIPVETYPDPAALLQDVTRRTPALTQPPPPYRIRFHWIWGTETTQPTTPVGWRYLGSVNNYLKQPFVG